MMKRALRQPNLILAVVTEVVALLVAFGVNVSDAQAAAILGLLGGLIALAHFVITPSGRRTPPVEQPGDN